MINEYLFSSDEHKKEVKALKFEGVTSESYKIKNTKLWIITYSAEGKNEESAKKLSDVHAAVMQYSPQILSCESAQYYNCALYPLINRFERKLRKLIYLEASISNIDKSKENIAELEKNGFRTNF